MTSTSFVHSHSHRRFTHFFRTAPTRTAPPQPAADQDILVRMKVVQPAADLPQQFPQLFLGPRDVRVAGHRTPIAVLQPHEDHVVLDPGIKVLHDVGGVHAVGQRIYLRVVTAMRCCGVCGRDAVLGGVRCGLRCVKPGTACDVELRTPRTNRIHHGGDRPNAWAVLHNTSPVPALAGGSGPN